MIVLLFIGFLFFVAGGLIWIAQRERAAVEQRWRTYAGSIGAAYTPRGKQPSSTIDLSCAGVPTRIFVYVGHALVGGQRTYFNSLRATATPTGGVGREFHLLYFPDLQAEPLLVGDDSPSTRAWLGSVEALVKARPGLQLISDGASLSVDLTRKRDSIADFELLTTIITKLMATMPSHAPVHVPVRAVAPDIQSRI
jgi:hypothetical protein